jgi:hypothetical protein
MVATRSRQHAPIGRSSPLRVGLAAGLAFSLIALSGAGEVMAQEPQDLAPDEPYAQYPFACTTEDAGLGQPLVDNQDGDGVPVFAEDQDGEPIREEEHILGWSRDCELETRFDYVYFDEQGDRHDLRMDGDPAPGERPADLATTTTIDGDEVDHIVRWERGTINRFIYSVAMLAPWEEVVDGAPDEPSHDSWNDRLVFSFHGGAGIGHTQGRIRDSSALLYPSSPGRPDDVDAVAKGYAVLYSTGTRTGDSNNMVIGGHTAMMVKDHFVETHGEPLYTVGIGDSGGGTQQFVYAQTQPGLLDAAVPQRTYPDLITAPIEVGDCAILEHYMDVIDADNPRWQDWDERQMVLGLNTIEGYLGSTARQLAQVQEALGLPVQSGSSECLEGWFGLSPLYLNPHFGSIAGSERLPADQQAAIERTHWNDLRNVFGTDPETGFARSAWDNVGVQYGLAAVADGRLTPEEFLDLNAHVGGWKDTEDMVDEGFPFEGSIGDVMAGELDFDPWSARNMHLSPDGGETPAQRAEADPEAIAGAFESGLVFTGDLPVEIPIVDIRADLEHELDMHNVKQSFIARQRLLDGQGHADNHIIWFSGDDEGPRGSIKNELAFEVVDEWMANIREHPERSVAENAPDRAVDSCFDNDGDLIAAGTDVWAGILDVDPDGACTERFEVYSGSRLEAGGPTTNDVFKCHTMPVGTAVVEGLYGDWEPGEADLARLSTIFPDGVCDYELRGVADPRAQVPGAVQVSGGPASVQVSGAEPGATIEVRQGGEVVAEFDAASGEGGLVGLPEGTYVVAQRVAGQRGLLSAPVTVTEDELHLPSFSDVPSSFVHHDAIVALAADGILEGYPDGTFRPLNTLTRGQLASALQRHLRLPAGPSGQFPDVVTDSPHGAAIEALAAAGVLRGYLDGRYGPNDPLRRDQLAGIVARAAGLQDVAGTSFTDTAGSAHRGAIEALQAEDVLRGYADGTFRPRNAITRGQFASILHGARDLLG